MKRGRWTETEKQHIQAHYSAIGARKLRELLPTRSEMAIMDMASRLGVHKCQDRLREMGRENVNVRWTKRQVET